MKFLSLIMCVTQFGFSALFPLCFFLWLAVRLQNRFGLGMWIVALLGIIGFLASIRTASICLRAMRREAEGLSDRDEPPNFKQRNG